MANLDKLNKIASNNSNWIEEAKKRRENRDWQKYSQKIAIKILSAIREKNIKQKQLAEMIGVSPQQINKIVKGNENLTLQTIAKIEKALNIELIFSKEENNNVVYKEIIKKELVYFSVYNNTKTVSKQITDYTPTREVFSENTDFEKAV